MSGPCRHSMCAASGAHAAPVHIPVRCLCQTTVWSISPRHYAIMPCHNSHFMYVGGATSTSSPSTSTASSLSVKSSSSIISHCPTELPKGKGGRATKITPVKASFGIITHQGHISQVIANHDSVSKGVSEQHHF